MFLTEQIEHINTALAQSIPHNSLFLVLHILLNDASHRVLHMTEAAAWNQWRSSHQRVFQTVTTLTLFYFCFCFFGHIKQSRQTKRKELGLSAAVT